MCGIKNGIKNNKIKYEKKCNNKREEEAAAAAAETEREIIISHLARNAHKSF